MVLIVGYLGEKLRKISNKAHLSAASLSAYLNEVFVVVIVGYLLHEYFVVLF